MRLTRLLYLFHISRKFYMHWESIYTFSFANHANFDGCAVGRNYKHEHDDHRNLHRISNDYSELRHDSNFGKYRSFFISRATTRHNNQMCNGASYSNSRGPANCAAGFAGRRFHAAAIKYGATTS